MTDPTTPAPADPAHPPAPPVHYERRKRLVGWQSRDIIRATSLVVAIYLAVRLLWVAHVLVFVVFLGVLFGLAVAGVVDRLGRYHIRRGIAAPLVVLGVLAVLYGLGAWMAPTLRAQGAELRTRLPQAMEKAEQWANAHDNGIIGTILHGESSDSSEDSAAAPAQGDSTKVARQAADSLRRNTAESQPGKVTLRDRIGSKVGNVTRYLFPFLHSTVEAVAGLLVIIFLSIYIAVEPELYKAGLMHLFPRKSRHRADQVLGAMAVALRKWLVTQIIAMAVMGAVTSVLLLVLHVKAALALGILTGLLQFIPTVGPILSSVPAIAMGFVDSPQKALTIALAYLLIHFLESHILTPLLMRGGVDLPPALTIVTQALMALVFGFIGLMVAVPVLAAVMVPIKMLYVEGVVGDPMDVLDEGEGDDG